MFQNLITNRKHSSFVYFFVQSFPKCQRLSEVVEGCKDLKGCTRLYKVVQGSKVVQGYVSDLNQRLE